MRQSPATRRLRDPDFNGGAVGPEARIWASLVGGSAAYVLIRKARQQGNWRPTR
jgi:hypothetical protein